MKNIGFILTLLVTFISFGQGFQPGKVSPSELSERIHPLEATAPAAVLFKTGSTSFNFDDEGNWIIVTDVCVRVKIYNQEGYKEAIVEIPYYERGNGKEQVSFYDAATYNLDGGKVIKTKLEKESEVVLEAGKGSKIKKITLPNVKDGSVIEYRYVKKSPYLTTIPDWYFQYSIPANFVCYNVSIPQFFVYNRILSPYIAIEEKQESKKATRVYSNPSPKVSSGGYNAIFQAENGRISFYETQKTYTARNVPSLSDDTYVDNISNYQSFVKHELASAEFPGSPKKDYTTAWDALSKLIYNQEGFGDELARRSYFEKDVDAILAKTTKREEVIAAIFDLVKNKMTWNGQYGYATSKRLDLAYNEATGNVADINFMLIAMLRYAGLNASPVLLSTREHGHVLFVSRDELNYVVAGVESQNGIRYLDATSKNAAPGVLPLRALNGTGRIIRENLTSSQVDMMPALNSKENTTVVAKVTPEGIVMGNVKKYYFDYDAYQFRENHRGVSKDNYLEGLSEKLDRASVKEYNVTDDNFSKPVTESFSFESNNFTEVAGGKIHISPMLLYTMSQNPFKHEKRSYPIDFTFPQQDKYTFSISLPEGYVVESLPESAYYQIKDNVGGFRFNISATKPDQVQVVVINDINYAIVNAEYYPAIKDFFNKVVQKQSEKIVLKKAL